MLPKGIYDFHDTEGTRKRAFAKVIDAFKKSFPQKGSNVDLEIKNLKIEDKDIPLSVQKKYLLEQRDLTVPLKGKVILKDKSGKVLEEKEQTLAQVPYYTGRGTFISNGNDFAAVNQFRLRPGVYARRKANGDLESHFNLQHGSGLSFRTFFEPKTAVFKLNVGQANLKMYPILKALGVREGDIEDAWGKEITEINKDTRDTGSVKKLYKKLLGRRAKDTDDPIEMGHEIRSALTKAKMDPHVNEITLSKGYDSVSPKVLLSATSKLLKINKGEDVVDDRDSVAFRKVYDVADFMAEKVSKDAGQARRKLFSRIDRAKSLKPFTPGYFTKQIKNVVITDTKVQPVEEVNPAELYDYQERIVSLGEGGIGSIEGVPEEARNVHPSQLGLVDPVRGPENITIGVDVRAAYNTFKGEDGRLYSKVLTRDGKNKLVPSDVLARSVVAFPGQHNKTTDIKVVDKAGTIRDAKKSEVDFFIPNGQGMFSNIANIIPGINNTEGRRLLMGSKFQVQALPLVEAEHPLVMNKLPDEDRPFENKIGMQVGGRPAKVSGKVTKITPDDIYVKGEDGKTVRHGVYNNFSFNRKAFIHQNPLVKPGDTVTKGQPLAKSTFTDEKGNLTLGRNLVTAYMPYYGYSVDDGIVVSESAAKKLAANLMYTSDQELTEDVVTGRKSFIANMPTTFEKKQLDLVDDDGVVKPGTKLRKGDPIILALHKKPLSASDLVLGRLHGSLKNLYSDSSQVWDHDYDGEVIDVAKTKKGFRVNIKTNKPLVESDKIANRYGGKGVIGKIVPDDQMPKRSDGKPVEVLFNPMGVPTRINPMQVFETLLGKVAVKRGKPYLLEPFSDTPRPEFVKQELSKAGLEDKEELLNPRTGKPFKDKILVGNQFFTRSFKTSESGFSSREIGTYSAEEKPTMGGPEGAKRIGGLLQNSLLGHGAVHNLREMMTIKGTKNTDFWRAMKLGQPLPTPKAPFIYDKFLGYLKASGINVKKEGIETRIQPMTRQDIDNMAGLEIKNDRLLRAKDLGPEKGGLFDFSATGGPMGQKWAHIKLKEAFPNPVVEEPLRRMLDMTQKQYEDVISGKIKVGNKVGGEAVKEMLGKLDVDTEIKKAKDTLKAGKKTHRDSAVKKLRYFTSFKKLGINPTDLVVDKWPVIPPQFRPVSVVGGGSNVVVSSPNLLYKDLIQSNDAFGQLKQDLEDEEVANERLGVYNALKASAGLTDPINPKTLNKNAKGFIQEIVGKPAKRGLFQYKVLSKTQDLVGRGVLQPDPTLNIDQIGVPEEALWKQFKPFIMRRLVRNGMPAVQADKYIEDRRPEAQAALDEEIKVRPVMIDRAPQLHKFNVMAGFAVPRKDTSIGFPVSTAAGYNADFDGDQMNVNVPVTEEARKEAIERMLPSKNLFSIKQHDVQFIPTQEAVLGLHYATKDPSKKLVRKFKTAKDAIRAYNNNEISINDRIEVQDV